MYNFQNNTGAQRLHEKRDNNGKNHLLPIQSQDNNFLIISKENQHLNLQSKINNVSKASPPKKIEDVICHRCSKKITVQNFNIHQIQCKLEKERKKSNASEKEEYLNQIKNQESKSRNGVIQRDKIEKPEDNNSVSNKSSKSSQFKLIFNEQQHKNEQALRQGYSKQPVHQKIDEAKKQLSIKYEQLFGKKQPSEKRNEEQFYEDWNNQYAELQQKGKLNQTKKGQTKVYFMKNGQQDERKGVIFDREKEKPQVDYFKMEKRRSKQIANKMDDSLSALLQCGLCRHKLTMLELDTHDAVCEARQEKCRFCSQIYPKDLLMEHYNYCQIRQSKDQRHKQELEPRKPNVYKKKKTEEQKFEVINPNYPDQPWEMSLRNYRKRNSIKDKSKESLQSIKNFHNRRKNTEEKQILRREKQEKEEMQRIILDIAEKSRIKNEGNKGLTGAEIGEIEESPFLSKKDENGEYVKEQCPICFTDFEETNIVRLRCLHIFHPDCIKPWLVMNSHCPSCKKSYHPDKKDKDYGFQK